MINRVVSVYINDTSLKLVVAQGKSVRKWAEIALEPGLVKDGVVAEEERVAAKIKELFKEHRVKTKKVVAGLSGLRCICRVINLPRLPKGLLAEAVKREAERAIPVPLSQVHISWQTLAVQGDQIKVFLAASPSDATDALIRTLRQAGLVPQVMDLAPLALARVVSRATSIILDVQPTEINLVVMLEGTPELIRTLPLTGEAIPLTERLPALREELERTINFYNSSHVEKPLGPGMLLIHVSGELAKAPEILESLRNEIGYTMVPMVSPLKHAMSFEPCQYMVNIGLALKKLSPGLGSRSVVNLNALPEIHRPKKFSAARVLVTTGILMVAGLLVSIAMIVQNSAAEAALLEAQRDATYQLLQKRQTQQQTLKKEIAELEIKLEGLEKTGAALAAALNGFSQYQEMLNRSLDVTLSSLPDSLTLTRITHTDTVLTVSGMSAGEAEILSYAHVLKDSGRFSEVAITSIQKTENGTRFTFTINQKGWD